MQCNLSVQIVVVPPTNNTAIRVLYVGDVKLSVFHDASYSWYTSKVLTTVEANKTRVNAMKRFCLCSL